MPYGSAGEYIANFVWKEFLPKIRLYMLPSKSRRREMTKDLILQLYGFYGSCRGLIGKRTRERVDKKVEELLNNGYMVGDEALKVWLKEVFYPLMEDKVLRDMLTKFAIIEERRLR